ncbi:MAG TPA: hypothetical protein VGM60_18475 [Pseudonocardia sp.]|uniref:hypothetical protein n=1 Tax=Pseudonocardia sp. TaxID=60912 RepID=UPI002F3F93F6
MRTLVLVLRVSRPASGVLPSQVRAVSWSKLPTGGQPHDPLGVRHAQHPVGDYFGGLVARSPARVCTAAANTARGG